jgi:hypothetical protein
MSNWPTSRGSGWRGRDRIRESGSRGDDVRLARRRNLGIFAQPFVSRDMFSVPWRLHHEFRRIWQDCWAVAPPVSWAPLAS